MKVLWCSFAISLLMIADLGPPLIAQEQLSSFDPASEQQRNSDLQERRKALNDFTPRRNPEKLEAQQSTGGPCFDIQEINVSGVSALDPKKLGALISSYVPGCLDGTAIQSVMQELDGAYAEAGHITTKTYIAPQNIASGTLVLTVLEGTVEGLYLVDADGLVEGFKARRLLKSAFPSIGNGIFQLRDVEQGLDQMNRLASVQAKMRLQPGERDGGSNIIVQRIQDDWFRGKFTYNNQGSESTGKNNVGLNFDIDDIMSANDTWSLSLTGTTHTNAVSFTGSTPYGYSTFNWGFSYSEYLIPLSEISELFGQSRTYDFGWKYLLKRDQTSTTTFELGIQKSGSVRYVNDAKLTPQNISPLKAKLTHITQVGKTKHSLDVSFTQGLKALEADGDPADLTGKLPHAQFRKLEAGWLRQKSLNDGAQLVTDVRLQFAPHSLYGSQQMSLGSKSTVRGYDISEAIGDMGLYLRSDYNYNFTAQDSELDQKLKDLSLSYFFDYGFTRDIALDKFSRAAGLGIGVGYKFGKLDTSLTYSVPLISENAWEKGPPLLTVNASVALF